MQYTFWLDLAKAEQKCHISCQVTEYFGTVKSRRNPDDDRKTYIGLTYQSTTVTDYEENLQYDILTFIGSVGGSLGLFVGFSFYDAFLIFGKLIWRKKSQNGAENSQNGADNSPSAV